jgi:hypothetical protein
MVEKCSTIEPHCQLLHLHFRRAEVSKMIKIIYNHKIIWTPAVHWCPTPIILVAWEAEIRKTAT